MTPTTILLIIIACIAVFAFLVFRIIEALHRISSRIESSNSHLDELRTEVSQLAEIVGNSLTDLRKKQEATSTVIEGLIEEVQDEDFYSDSDTIYEKAKEIVIKEGKASASLLQRRLSIGYARAARLIDKLENEGIIGPQIGAAPRRTVLK